ncbi:HNH endonuclease, partial [Nocardioides sp. NPDC058538]
MSLEHDVNHWGSHPGDAIDAALAAIETALHELLASDPVYWRTELKKDLLERLEKLQAMQAALSLRVLATSGDIAEETGDKDASAWMRAELLLDKGVARSQIKLATSIAKYDLVTAGLAEGVVSQDKARVITKALDQIEADPVAST